MGWAWAWWAALVLGVVELVGALLWVTNYRGLMVRPGTRAAERYPRTRWKMFTMFLFISLFAFLQAGLQKH